LRKQIDLTAPGNYDDLGDFPRKDLLLGYNDSDTILRKDVDDGVGCDIDGNIDHEYQPRPAGNGKTLFTTITE
jgi:hypothetical protein